MATRQETSIVKIASDKPGVGKFEIVVVNGEVQYVEATPEDGSGNIIYSNSYKLIKGLVDFIKDTEGEIKTLQMKNARNEIGKPVVS